MDQVKWESELVPGTTVEARWTNSFVHHIAQAEVVRVNRSSVRVRVVEESSYLHGRELSMPRFFAAKWSSANGVFPFVEVEYTASKMRLSMLASRLSAFVASRPTVLP